MKAGGSRNGPRRILYVEANEDGTVGGSHQALYDLVRHLDRARFEPVILFYQDNPFARRLRDENFEVHLFEVERERELEVRTKGGRVAKLQDVIGAILRRWRFLRLQGIDAVHINNSPLVGNDDWLPAARLFRIPILANAMGDARWFRGGIHRWLSRRFDRVLPISEFMTEAMVANGIAPRRITSIRLGVDLDDIRARVRTTTLEVREALGLGQGQRFLVMVGNVREWKGQHVLLEALSRLTAEERSRLHVAFAGAVDAASTAYSDRLRTLEHAAGLTTTVSWLGARNDVPDLFAAADLTVHCSIRPEPFGLVIVESMALGTPVVASDAGGPAEVVTRESGWLYSPGQADELAAILREVLHHPHLLEERGRGALARAADFSVSRTVEKTLEAYEILFRHPSRS